MNEPLINPWFFYLIDTCCSLRTLSIIFAAFTGILGIISLLESISCGEEEEHNKCIKFAKRCSYCLVVFCLLIITIPSSTTIYKMMLAQYVTKANIIATGEAVDKVLDKAVEKIIKIKESK